jgi:tail length tape measure protein
MALELVAHLRAKNQTGPGFKQMRDDARVTATAVEQSGRRASAAVAMQTSALGGLGRASRQAAFQQRMLMFQVNDVVSGLLMGQPPMMVAMQQGGQIAQIYGQGEGGVARAFKEAALMIGRFAVKLIPVGLAVGAAAATVAGLTREINKANDAQVTFGDTARAAWQVFAETITGTVQPAFAQIGEWAGQLWDMIAPPLKALGNNIIGTFDLAFKDVGTLWKGLAPIVGSAATKAANLVISPMETMVNRAIELINKVAAASNQVLGTGFAAMDDVNLVIQGPDGGGGFDLKGQLDQNRRDVFNADYLGGAFDAISERAIAISKLGEVTEAAGTSALAANDNLAVFAEGVGGVANAATEATRALQDAFGGAIKGFFSEIRSGVPMVEALGNAFGKLSDQLMEMALNQAITSLLASLFGGGGGLGPIPLPQLAGGGGPAYGGPSLTSLRFANGGAFKVGGVGGTDSQMVQFMATPGELVDVRTPGQAANGNSGGRQELRVTISMDESTGALAAFVQDEAGRVVASAAPAIVNAGARQAIQGIGQGAADGQMRGRFAARPRAVAR